jgi:HIT domain
MQTDTDCVFCKIIAGQIPCVKLLEEDETLAFMDINPAHDGHCLVITKSHYPTVFEITEEAFVAVALRSARSREPSILHYRRRVSIWCRRTGKGPSNRSSISIFTCCRANLATTLSSIGALNRATVKPSPRLRRRSVLVFRVLRAGISE